MVDKRVLERLSDQHLLEGLKSLADLTDPLTCQSCGKTYNNIEEFVEETLNLAPENSPILTAQSPQGQAIIELVRRCTCGEPLRHQYPDRRDLSKTGLKRRQKFESLLDKLVDRGILKTPAREALIAYVRGEGTEKLEKMGLRMPKTDSEQ